MIGLVGAMDGKRVARHSINWRSAQITRFERLYQLQMMALQRELQPHHD